MNRIFLFALLPILLLGSGCVSRNQFEAETDNQAAKEKSSNRVLIKYRNDAVNLSDDEFETFDTSRSSFIHGAWFDDGTGYLVLLLNTTYYHYCNLSEDIWSDFKSARSLGRYYNQVIKGNYSCEGEVLPTYK